MAAVDASQKIHSSLLCAWLSKTRVHWRGILTYSSSFSVSLHSSHSLYFSSGRGASQSQASVVSSPSKNLPWMLTEAVNPSGCGWGLGLWALLTPKVATVSDWLFPKMWTCIRYSITSSSGCYYGTRGSTKSSSGCYVPQSNGTCGVCQLLWPLIPS